MVDPEVDNAPTLALLRIDADAYDGVLDALEGAYHRLSPGGFLIIDDFVDWQGCAEAIRMYRKEHAITEPITLVPHLMDGSDVLRGAYWRKAPTTDSQRTCVGAPPGSLRAANSYNPPTLTRLTPKLLPPDMRWLVDDDVHVCLDHGQKNPWGLSEIKH